MRLCGDLQSLLCSHTPVIRVGERQLGQSRHAVKRDKGCSKGQRCLTSASNLFVSPRGLLSKRIRQTWPLSIPGKRETKNDPESQAIVVACNRNPAATIYVVDAFLRTDKTHPYFCGDISTTLCLVFVVRPYWL